MSLTLSSLVSWPTSLQYTENSLEIYGYIDLFEADPSLSAPLTDWFLHSTLMERCCHWAQSGSGSWSLWKVGPDSGHSTPPPIWTTDLQKRRERRQQSAGNQTVMIHACAKPSDLYTESPWAAGGAVVSPTQSVALTSILPIDDQRRPASTGKKNRFQTSWVIWWPFWSCICFRNYKGGKVQWTLLTEKLDAQALRLRTMAGCVLNTVSSIRPLTTSRSAAPPWPWWKQGFAKYLQVL